jgi:putative ABC transport system permease protein
VDAPSYLALYPEYVLTDDEKKAFLLDRQGVIVGRKLADTYGWKVGDQIPLRGTIYPGTWTFTVRGIWDGADARTDESQLLMHWQLPQRETARKRLGRSMATRWGCTLWHRRARQRRRCLQRIDTLFRNSLAETLTETEKAFQLSFVSMSEAILVAIRRSATSSWSSSWR